MESLSSMAVPTTHRLKDQLKRPMGSLKQGSRHAKEKLDVHQQIGCSFYQRLPYNKRPQLKAIKRIYTKMLCKHLPITTEYTPLGIKCCIIHLFTLIISKYLPIQILSISCRHFNLQARISDNLTFGHFTY